MAKRLKSKSRVMDNDQFLTKNFEKIVDEYAGGFVIIGKGRILYTNKDGTAKGLIEKARAEFPGLVPLFFRVPYPHEFVCALIVL